MPNKRKRKHVSKRSQRTKKNSTPNKQSKTKHLSQSQLIQLLEAKRTEPEFVIMSELTHKDEQICNKIKLDLCNYLEHPISAITNGRLCANIFTHIPGLKEDLGVQSEFAVGTLVSQLQSKFGIGSLVRYSYSAKHFFHNKFVIPKSFMLVLNKECIFRNVVFIPHNILKIIGITVETHYDTDKEYLYTVIICDSSQNETNFVYYQSLLFFREKQFEKFLKKDKWNSNTLRTKLPEFAKFFKTDTMSDSCNKLTPFIHKVCNINKFDSLRVFTDFWIPQNLASFVKDLKQQKLIENLVNNLYKKCDHELFEAKFQWLRTSKVLNTVPTNKAFIMMSCQFPFILDCLKAVSDIMGDVFIDIMRARMLKNENYLIATKMYELTQRIEGRNCSYCNKKEMRNGKVNEKFKKCKGCENVWYCSIVCQKKHWNKTHRLTCTCNK